ncbi:DUF916 and DUF3324 domain-containing protein [Enterococcus sp. AZ072]|uniref:DUF916 and DUF3324 domain-containing protein n=1 Tax=unclassified Enterococcus TaxID=2608891 RepID=UPI003D2E90DF
MKFKIKFIISILFLSIAFFPAFVNAENVQKDKASTKELGFTVQAVLPENQIDHSSSFFDLLLDSMEQTVEVEIISTRKEPVTVTIGVSNAGTSNAGEIVYTDTEKTKDKTLVDPVTDLVASDQKEIQIENYETKKCSFKIKPPQQKINGARIGALSFMSKISESDEQVQSVYGYRIGMILLEEDTFYKDGNALNLQQVRPNIINGRKVIEAQLQNPQPKILEPLTVETVLKKKGEDQVLKHEKVSNMRMAPNSHFSFLTNWGLDKFKKGTYVLSIRASSSENKWAWEKEFSINADQAQKLEKNAAYKITYPKWVIYAAIAMVILTLGLFSYLLFRRN